MSYSKRDQIQDLPRLIQKALDGEHTQTLIDLVGQFDANDDLPYIFENIKLFALRGCHDELLAKTLSVILREPIHPPLRLESNDFYSELASMIINQNDSVELYENFKNISVLTLDAPLSLLENLTAFEESASAEKLEDKKELVGVLLQDTIDLIDRVSCAGVFPKDLSEPDQWPIFQRFFSFVVDTGDHKSVLLDPVLKKTDPSFPLCVVGFYLKHIFSSTAKNLDPTRLPPFVTPTSALALFPFHHDAVACQRALGFIDPIDLQSLILEVFGDEPQRRNYALAAFFGLSDGVWDGQVRLSLAKVLPADVPSCVLGEELAARRSQDELTAQTQAHHDTSVSKSRPKI